MVSERSSLRTAEAEYGKVTAGSQTANTGSRTPWLWYGVAALWFGIDRVLKLYALSGIEFGQRGHAEFVLYRNTGIAFSIPVPPAYFWPLAAVAVAALLIAFVRALQKDVGATAPIVIVMAGAASNLMDRLTNGATIDYLMLFGRSAVNIADGLILVGLVWLIVRKESK